MQKNMLVFQTDFTYKEGAVCAMYGVVKSVDRAIEIIDATHELPQYDIWSASYRLYQSMKFWPEGTVFVSVVDPGVGTERKACVALTNDGYYIVTPDNGTLTHIKKYVGIKEIRQIDETINRLHGKDTEGVSIFHGRDLFGYCAAKLCSEKISYEEVGPAYSTDEIKTYPIAEPVITDNGIEGIFEINDPNFGNLWTNIPTKMMLENGFAYGENVHVTIEHEGKIMMDEDVHFDLTFGSVEKGQPVVYNNELMKVSLAVCMGNFCEKYGMTFGPDWKIRFAK